MRKISALPLLVILVSGCAHPGPNFFSNQIITKHKESLVEFVSEKTGLVLDEDPLDPNFLDSKDYLVVKSTASVISKTVERPKSALEIRDVSELVSGDILIAINGQSLENVDPRQVLENLKFPYKKYQGNLFTFFNLATKDLKLVSADCLDPEQLMVAAVDIQEPVLKMVAVEGVASGSWGERAGFKKGDVFIGKAVFFEEVIYRHWALGIFKTKRIRSLEPREIPLHSNKMVVEQGFHSLFPELPEFMNENGDVMEWESMLVLTVARGNQLVVLNPKRHQFLGLGIKMKCDPFCGKAEPLVEKVFAGSDAEKAGFRAGDLVKEVNGKKIKTSWDVIRIVQNVRVGKEAEFKVYRGYESLIMKIRVDWVTVE